MTDVVIVQWPEEQEDVKRLADLGIPRLLLVAPAADPPDAADLLEDWVRMPSDDRDIRARLKSLRRRVEARESRPIVDRHGRLLFRGAWVQLSPIEERLARVLAEADEAVVAEDDLLRRGWPSGNPTANALRVHLHRLRRRVERLGLEIRCVRSTGWIMQTGVGNEEGVSFAAEKTVAT